MRPPPAPPPCEAAGRGGEPQRVSAQLLVAVEESALALGAVYARPPRAPVHQRGLALAVDAEVHAFEVAQRLGQLAAVGLLAAVERRVAAQAEAGRGDPALPTRPSHVAHDLVAVARQVRLKVDPPVLNQVHPVVGEEHDLRLGARGPLYLAQE